MLPPTFNQNTFYPSTLLGSSVLLVLSSTSSKMRLCMEEERKRPFVSCDLYALCKPTLEQGTVLPFSEVLRPPLGFWLTILPSVFTGGGCNLYKQSEFSTPSYLGPFISTVSLVMFYPLYSCFHKLLFIFCWHVFSHQEDFELMTTITLSVPKQLYMGKGNSHSSNQNADLINHSWSVNLKHKEWPPQNTWLWSVLKAENFKHSPTQNTPMKTAIWKQEEKMLQQFHIVPSAHFINK